jgi:glycosyltransferase involved in cell wall biosynthesis
LPAFRPLPADFPIPWIGYLYDFQHKYYPSFFTNAEIKIRENNFAQMLRKAKTIIVNSQSVKDDIEKFYKNSTSSIITLPFCPVFNSDFYQLQTNIDQYHLPSQYFMISNQFWKHKDHSTAFKAYKLMLNKLNTTNIGLVCTGQTYDERFPTYFNELQKLISELGIEKNVFILGFIPKIDQLQILKNSLGIIQPTLFEGGPGGGAVYESVAYGISSIVSDIPVNLEIQDETVTFFKSGSVEDLANKMITLIKQPKHKHTFDELRTKNEQVLIKFGSTIIKALEEPI